MVDDRFFNLLEEKFLTYSDLIKIPVEDCGEEMVSLRENGVSFTLLEGLLSPSTGSNVYVRQKVVDLLIKAQFFLQEILNEHILDVVYGYRSQAIQKENYHKIKSNIATQFPDLDESSLNEAVHRYIAIPNVAGHPTGGAVDVRILTPDGKQLDMGSDLHAFSKESYTFNPYLSKDVWLNRQKLRQCMLLAGFAPFDGEWWHFSYGDREWAAYYNRPLAFYDQIDFRI
ncbi:MAG: hypothetical protein H6868_03080 [Rhodospirillales bacterium]|nr:hypothetical protein [Rhodospirillales bacterium]